MATESNMAPINGSYAAPPQYNAAELPAHQPVSTVTTNGANGQNAAANNASAEYPAETPSKDEVGWYFVEQYYTTMSKSPDKLHLFYAKKSQFVSGVEAEKVSVSVGQRAISERIKALSIEDCKVRVTNVDSQESTDKSIVIQVIGEMSMRSDPHRKFAQSFVLAKQHNGYYVLNDIFRYLADEEDEEEEVEAQPEPEPATAPEPEAKIPTLTSSDNLAEQAKDAEAVDALIEKKADEEPAAVAAANAPEPTPEAPAKEPTPEPEPEIEEPVAVEEVVKPELPKDPEPTRAATPEAAETKPAPSPAPAAEEPAAPAKPSAPKTWASMLAGPQALKAATPAIPATPSQPKKQQAPAPAQVATTAASAAEESQPLPSPGGWQTAGQDHGKKQNRQQSNSVSAGTDTGKVLGYIKNVTERVDAAILKSTINKYGKLDYFDISRQKNCAFVEFADRAGYEAAAAANPHSIGGESIYVEERRPRGAGYNNAFQRGGPMRGGRGGMEGRPPSQGGRGGFQKEGGRGNFTPRGGRGNMAPRGRGGMTQTA